MTESLDMPIVEPMDTSIAPSQESPLPPPPDLLSEVDTPAPVTSYEVDAPSHPPLWQPTTPQFTKAIAQYYGVSRKSVQQWFQRVKEACPWWTEADLKLPDERYTPLCIELMGDYRVSGLSAAKWAVKIQERFQAQSIASPSIEPPIETTSVASGSIASYQANEVDQQYLSYELPQIAYQRPSDNRLVHLLNQKLHQLAHINEQGLSQIGDFQRALQDTETTLQALEDMSAIEQGIAKADRHEYLTQQAYVQRRQQHQATRIQPATPAEATPAPKPEAAPVGASG